MATVAEKKKIDPAICKVRLENHLPCSGCWYKKICPEKAKKDEEIKARAEEWRRGAHIVFPPAAEGGEE